MSELRWVPKKEAEKEQAPKATLAWAPREKKPSQARAPSLLELSGAYVAKDQETRDRVLEEQGLSTADPGFWKGFAAEMVASIPTDIGVAGGMALGAPVAPPFGMILGGMLGGMGADQARQIYSQFGMGSPPTSPPQSVLDSAVTAGADIAGGAVVGRAVQAGKAAIDRLRSPSVLGEKAPIDFETAETFNRNVELSRRTGIPMTLGELMERPSLIKKETMMRELPMSADPMDRFLSGRAKKTKKAADDFGKSLIGGRRPNPMKAYGRLGRAAQEVRQRAVDYRRAETKPRYDRIMEHIGDSTPDVSDIAEKYRHEAGREVGAPLNEYTRVVRFLSDPKGITFERLHRLQSDLRDRATKDSTTPRAARALNHMRTDILDALNSWADKMGMPYRAVGQRYKDLTRPIEVIETEALTGDLFLRDPIDVRRRARTMLQSNVQAQEILRLRRLIKSVDADTWQEFAAAHFENEVERALSPQQRIAGTPNVAGRISQKFGGGADSVLGDVQKAKWKAILAPAELRRLTDLTTAMDKTTGIMQLGSQTAMRSAYMEEMLGPGGGAAIAADLARRASERSAGGLIDRLFAAASSPALKGLLMRKFPFIGMENSYGRKGREIEAYANLLAEHGTEGSVKMINRLKSDILKASRLPKDQQPSAVANAWGVFLFPEEMASSQEGTVAD